MSEPLSEVVEEVVEEVAVAIVGGGPAGLTAAANLARAIPGEVRVIERETATGGIPRHSDHTGYGLRDLRRVLTGPKYAQRLTGLAADAGAVLETSAMVTGWADSHTLEVTSPRGRRLVRAQAIVLATGARERARAARLIPGDRPDGVYTTGQLQNLVHLHHAAVGSRAVIVGAELVSWSAVLTLREAGCTVVLMTSEYPRPESYAVFNALGRTALRTPVATRTRVVRINGRRRVESVEIEDGETGARRIIACDTVVTTGDWIPDNELVRAAGLDLDPATLGPRVDTALRTSRPGVFAAGNLLHPVDTADIAALDGKHVAAQLRSWWSRRAEQPPAGLSIVVEKPLRWVAPQVFRPGDPAPPRHRLLFWCDEFVPAPRVRAVQDGITLAARRLPWPASPGRVLRVSSSLVQKALPAGGPITITLD